MATILIVDDEASIRSANAILLRRAGYSVLQAGNGQQALELISDGAPDLVITDLRMPIMDGHELIARLRAEGIPCQIIAMSAFAELDEAMRSLSAGADDFLVKPFRAPQLRFAVSRALSSAQQSAEVQRLRRERDPDVPQANSAGENSDAYRHMLDQLERVAPHQTDLLIHGESGSGKERVARLLHSKSSRAARPFVAINCGAVAGTLLESELFGHARGAFTGASKSRVGLIEQAQGGTLFLDEIGDMAIDLQTKLLRVIQEREVRRLGENLPRAVDVRIVAATWRDLRELVRKGSFREDLFYRIHGLVLQVPPLRERKSDIIPLAERFLHEYSTGERSGLSLSPAVQTMLEQHSWPGNVRELQNVMRYVAIMGGTPEVYPDDLPQLGGATMEVQRSQDEGFSIKEGTRALEKRLIEKALTHTGGNRTAAAKLLEISHRSLLYKLKDYFPDGGV